MDTMVVNTSVSSWGQDLTMSDVNTKTISIRVPKDVAQWVTENGGSAMLKSVLYAHILTRTYGISVGTRGKLLQTIIEENATLTLATLASEESQEQANIRLD